MSNQPPSQRNPLALLSKLLTKSPPRSQQPIEHQYLPVPTATTGTPESLHAQSTYSCSNLSSSGSSFVFIDHNEEPASSPVDNNYTPFLPLIIQHERLQQRLAAAVHPLPPPILQTRGRQTPSNDPPSPTSTASSKSPVTPPIFVSSFFGSDNLDLDEIMTLGSSEVASISEYSLPKSLSVYMQQGRSISRKSSLISSSESEYRLRGMAPPSNSTQPRPIRRYSSKRSFPPAPSPPPSWPLPQPPVSVGQLTRGSSTTGARPDSAILIGDATPFVPDSQIHKDPDPTRRSRAGSVNALTASTSVQAQVPESISKNSELPISHSTSMSSTSTAASSFPSTSTATSANENEHEKTDDDNFVKSSDAFVSTPTPIPIQYGVGRQVIRGSGCDLADLGAGSKRSSKRSSKGASLLAEDSKPHESKAIPVETDDVRLDSDPEVRQEIPTQRRRVQSDDMNPNIHPNDTRRTHHEKSRERINPEWTLFLGVPRNAPPPVPTALPINPVLVPSSSVEPNPNHPNFAPTVPTPALPHLAITKEHRNRPTYLPMITTTTNMTLRNRTKSDSALLASAASPTASGSDGTKSAAEDDGKKAKTKTKAKRVGGGEDWTLSLPLNTPSAPPVSSSASGFLGSGSGERGGLFETPSMVSAQAVVEEECERAINVGEEEGDTGLVITVEDVDRQRRQQRGRSDEGEGEESLILRVPRIVRSCSSSPLLSSHNNRTKKGSAKWMGATSTPNLRARGVERSSSSTLEEEVMLMLLGNDDTNEEAQEDESTKARSKSRKDLAAAMVLAQKKMAILDEDLARFNALLRNGNSGESQQPSTTVVETAAPVTKTKTVTLNSNPIPASTTSTPPKSSTASQSLIIKPVLKHAKSCEPFLESHTGTGLAPSPVMRFPSSTGKGDLNFFDELGSSGGRRRFGPTTSTAAAAANLRSTKSAEWRMGDVDLISTTLPLTANLPFAPVPPPASPPSSPSSSSSSRASPPPPQRTTRNSTSSTSTTCTVLLPFASTPSSSSSSVKYSPPSAFNSKSKGCSFPSGMGVEMNGGGGSGGARKGVPISIRTCSIRAVSMGSLTESGVGASQKEKQGPPKYLPRLHSSSFSSSPSSSSSSHQHLISHNRRSISPPPPPSPIPSESSSTLPTPLASAFPLPPSSIRMTEFGGVVAFQQKLKEFESARKKHLLQQQQRNQHNRSYRPPSTASSVASLISNASSTATVVPSGDQKLRMRTGDRRVSSSSDGVVLPVAVALSSPVENGRYIEEDDEDSMYSGTYYSARSSFSS